MKASNLLALCAAINPFAALAFTPLSSGSLGVKISASPINRLSISKSKTTLLFSSENDNDWAAPKSAMIGGAGVNNAGEPPFEIRGFSLGNLVVLAGILITVLSFGEYLSDSGSEGLNVSGLGFVYGIPVFLAGAALKYAEIEPVPCFSAQGGEEIFEEKATEIIRKVKQDVTRHRYGDEAHLDTTVRKLGLVVPGKSYPQLRELRQEKTEDGELAFTMVWQSVDTPYKLWADEKRRQKYETFFGPGVGAEVVKVDAEQRLVGIRLTTGGPLKMEKVEA
eukprot:CAMPEP_0184872664 /NCGR_PEP_ID=MMETSP0580-20130426/41419_1 /TAXON_ID=1118495 /ORGANISM="Dactyliosolen fragilissimus" /LENGTH=278 /DNA_ID=CAMNT_0027375495 /DNA_START=25 /DNA_END=861 /DNA_ORIENTATION=-